MDQIAPAVRAPDEPVATVDLYWLPLGAGGHSVGLNGRVYEALAACIERRDALDLYHSALEVRVPGERFVIEQTPVPDAMGEPAWRGGDRRGRKPPAGRPAAVPL